MLKIRKRRGRNRGIMKGAGKIRKMMTQRRLRRERGGRKGSRR